MVSSTTATRPVPGGTTPAALGASTPTTTPTSTTKTTLATTLATRRFWAYATTFGAVWGIFEITVGTFLHTVRLPFAGHLLALVSVALLVAQRQLLPVRGLTLATGLVAAACKAVSPSGIILGPMVGIVSEALLVELALLAAPRALLSAAIAGACAALWPLLQKLLTQLLLYGGTVVALYLEGLRRLGEISGISGGQAVTGGIVAVGVVASLGAAAGFLGRALGRRVGPTSAVRSAWPRPAALAPVWADRGTGGRSRDLLVGLAFFLAIALQSGGGAVRSLVGLALVGGALGLLRPAALRRLWRPRFWAFTLLLAGASGLLLGEKDIGVPGVERALLSSAGAAAGLSMVARGALVFALTSWAAVALRPDQLLRLARRVGAGHLGEAIVGALGLLPALRPLLSPPVTQDVAPPTVVRFSPRRTIAALVRGISEASALAERAACTDEEPPVGRPVIAAVVGGRGEGKTGEVQRIASALRERSIDVAGVCQPAHLDRGGYDLLDLGSGARRPLAQRRRGSSSPAARDARPLGFDFDPQGWSFATEVVEEGWGRASVIIVDELGRLEAEGAGHMEVVEVLLRSAPGPRLLVLGVQAAVSAQIESRLGSFDLVCTFPAAPDELRTFLDALVDVAVGDTGVEVTE